MSLTSTDTLATVIDQLLANSQWYGDATKAAAYVEAVEWLEVKFPTSLAINHRNTTFQMDYLKAKAAKADKYLQRANAGGSRFRLGDFRESTT